VTRLTVVANSSPLIYLAALSDLDLLPAIFKEIHIPPAVWIEAVDQAQGFPVQPAVREAAKSWLHVTPLSPPPKGS
jgi:hypothetical protein